MTTPKPNQIIAALADMRSDAAVWREIAAEMREAARVADRLDLGPLQWSFLADQLGMVDLYRLTQDRLVALLGEAGLAYESLARALDTAADNYYVDDDAGARRLGRIR